MISVVIPCYNAAAFLAEALASVAAQTVPADEVVVIDDGSTDDSAAIAAAHPAVRVWRYPHEGIAATRNAGVALAAGDIIAFLDADDLWPPDSIAVRLGRLDAEPELDCVYGAVAQFDAAGAIGEPRAGRLAGAMLLRRRVFQRIGGFDLSLAVGETLDFVTRMDHAGLRSAAVAALVLRRRIHGGNTMLTRPQPQGDYLKLLKASLDRRRPLAERG